MSGITRSSTIVEIAARVSEALSGAGITAVLSGGAAVSVYVDGHYQSLDLDFVSSASNDEIAAALSGLGFQRDGGRYMRHPDTDFFLEFPAGPLAIGGEFIRDWTVLDTPFGKIQILSPTLCVMDRLAAWYHWHDPQALEQAVLVATRREVDLGRIEAWSKAEGYGERFAAFSRQTIAARGD